MVCSSLRAAQSVALLFATGAVAFAQATPAPSDTISPVVATALVRERTNATQWFSAYPNAEVYGYQDTLLHLSIAQQVRHFDYMVDVSQAAELGLPRDAVSTVGAQGQLGLGGSYYAANGNNPDPAAGSFRQGFLRYRFNRSDTALRVGRFEFFDGQETTPANTTLAWLQTNRIAQRLVGNFGFTDGQRSFDGADGKLGGRHWDLTAMAGRATQGVFNMNANPELNVDIQYAAWTRSLFKDKLQVRTFGLGYHDGRTGLTKTDNRPAKVRALDHRNIRIGTYGADAIAAVPAGHTTVDLLFWGVLQNGQWGRLSQHSGAFDTEAGIKLDTVPTMPWLRGGVLRSTGDTNNADTVHTTFFAVLPTPRVYARFPYYNTMNSEDRFVQLIDTPDARLNLRSDLHFLKLTAPADLWYTGGGAFDNKVFGYTGRPANGYGSFSSVADISADYALTKQISISGYYAHAFGRSVIHAIYPDDKNAQFGFFELDYKLSRVLGHGKTP